MPSQKLRPIHSLKRNNRALPVVALATCPGILPLAFSLLLATSGAAFAAESVPYDPTLDTTPVPVLPQGTPKVAPARSEHGGRIFPTPSGASSSSSGGFATPANSAPLTGGTDSTTLKTGTNSTTLKTGTDSTTLQTGTNNTTLQVGTQNTTLQTGTDSSLLRTGVERQAEPVNILFIVDGSRSMLESLEPRVQKIDAAKQVLQNALSRIPPDVNLGLRVFGQGYNGANSSLFAGGLGGLDIQSECRNTALWVPIGKGNRRAIIEKVRDLKPYGMTPLAYSIAQAAFTDFRNCQGSKVIILITDGADTCNGDPCTVIKQLLPRYGIKIKVDVVGLSLHREPQARNQLNCVAEKSGGKYYDAKTAADLVDSVSASVSKAIEGRVIIKPSQTSTDRGGNRSGVNPVNTETPPDLVPIEPLNGLPK
ncbi:MAG: VWA domain-containing protein [Cyanobacteria bacterium SZAS LIN-3]|nr:VWA domain-containing protein [Cyanobacteria bacterium SZAS LIN-3]